MKLSYDIKVSIGVFPVFKLGNQLFGFGLSAYKKTSSSKLLDCSYLFIVKFCLFSVILMR